MKTRIIRIGNSRGIRLPKVLLDRAQLPEEVELHAECGRLVIQAARGPRFGWAEEAKACAHGGKTGCSTSTRPPVLMRRAGSGIDLTPGT